MLDVRDLAKLIMSTLREMGQDTVEMGPGLMRNGQPYPILSGLRGYPWYHSTLAGVNRFNESRSEEPYWDGLCARLRRQGISAITECTYPGTSKRCDLVVDLAEGARVWIEGKLALEHRVYHYGTHYYWEGKPLELDASWNAVPDVAKDMRKLRGLSRASGNHVAVLLLGFDRVNGALDADAFYQLIPEELQSGWQAFHETREGISWPDQLPQAATGGFRDRFWFWHRAIE